MAAITTTVFGLGAVEVKKKLNPKNEPYLFTYSDTGEITETDVLETLNYYEEFTLGQIPERYRRLLYHVDGEVLTTYHVATTATYTLGLIPVSGVVLYQNYDSRRPWSDRCHDDCLESGWSVANSTGVVTLTTGVVTEGDTLAAEYNHTAGAGCRVLRHLALNLAAAEWARRLYPPDRFEQYRDWELQSFSAFKRMREVGDGRMGVPMLDALNLVRETRSDSIISDLEGGGYI